MIINYLSSYDRSFKRLSKTVQERAISAIDILIEFFQTRQKPLGIGLKKIHKNYWEIRLDIRHRIIFELSGDEVNIVFVGSHGMVKTFLKNA